MEDLISVIVPVYNVENYLKKCLNSLLNQNYSNYEIIVVDDGSTDYSGKICDDFANKYSIITVVHKKNGGLSSARNKGLEIAKGSLISFVDSDDYVSNNFLSELYKNMMLYKSNISICSMYYCFKNKNIKRISSNSLSLMDFEQAFIEMNRGNYFDMAVWNKLFKKNLFDNIKFPVGKKSEDYYVMYLLFEKAQIISYVPKHLYYYVQRENSISKSKNINYDHLYAAKQQLDYIKERGYTKLINESYLAVCSSYLTIYDFFLKAHVKPYRNFIMETKQYLKQNFRLIINSNICYSKKIQFILFIISKSLYNSVFKIYRKIRRVQ